jgi:hypothetical protein
MFGYGALLVMAASLSVLKGARGQTPRAIIGMALVAAGVAVLT